MMLNDEALKRGDKALNASMLYVFMSLKCFLVSSLQIFLSVTASSTLLFLSHRFMIYQWQKSSLNTLSELVLK
jgi:hypothetical protein